MTVAEETKNAVGFSGWAWEEPECESSMGFVGPKGDRDASTVLAHHTHGRSDIAGKGMCSR